MEDTDKKFNEKSFNHATSHQHLVTFNDLDDCWEYRGELIYINVLPRKPATIQ